MTEVYCQVSRGRVEAGRRPAQQLLIMAAPARLSRTLSSSSVEHVRSSLRRMATHETGEHVTLEAHAEKDSRQSDEENQLGRNGSSEDTVAPIEEEKEGKKDKFELQDQTNLLPFKQLVLVFVGLSAALFCSLLDQTM